MTERHSRPAPTVFREGWAWLLLTTTAHAYLVFLLTLAAIATLPLAFGWHGSVVQSGSMEPKISPGDVVLSTALPADSPIPLGGVVEFTRPMPTGPGTMSVMHRIVADNGDGTYTTAGDANTDVDSTPLSRGNITGQARVLVPLIGLPGLWIGTSNLPALAAWLVLTLLAIVVSALAFTPRKRQDGDPNNEPEDPAANRDHKVPAGPSSRRAFLALSLGSAAVGLLALPRPGTTTAFTARTSSTGNSWSVRAVAPLVLGRLSPYALFAAKGIVNEGANSATYITGSAGTSPGTLIDGFSSWQISGSEDRNNQVARNARTDAIALLSAVDARKATTTLKPALTGTVLPGVHKSSTGAFAISNTLTLDARGDPNAVFVFTAGAISTVRDSYIRLVNGTRANNVFWRSTGPINILRGSVASGNFLASGNVVVDRDADLTGRFVTLNGSISLTRTTARLPA